MTLKHKNSSKWAKRILQRGLNSQDEGTRAAIAEQLQQHALLTRKMKSMKDSSSSSDSDDSDDEDAGSDQEEGSKLLEKAKQKTLKVLEEDDEVPDSGVLSLPFMVILLLFPPVYTNFLLNCMKIINFFSVGAWNEKKKR